MPQGYVRVSDLPQVVPLFPLDEAMLLPRGQLPLIVFEPRYLNMLDDVMAGDRIIGMIHTAGGSRARPNLAAIGCAGRVTSYAETSDGRYLITLTGVARFDTAGELPAPTPYRQMRADYSRFEHDLQAGPDDPAFDRDELLGCLKAYLARHSLDVDWDTAGAAPQEALINSLCMGLPFDAAEKQALLEAIDLPARREALCALLTIDAAEPTEGGLPHMQ